MISIVSAIVLAASAAAAPAPAATPAAAPVAAAATGDVVRGEKRFKVICMTCHTLDPAQKKIGPHLKGVMGRKAGTVEGFSYSPALKTAGWIWDAQRMDPYLEAPSKVIKGSKMLNVLPNPKDRADIIAYLATVK